MILLTFRLRLNQKISSSYDFSYMFLSLKSFLVMQTLAFPLFPAALAQNMDIGHF